MSEVTLKGLQIFVIVIAKEGLAGTRPAMLSFGMTPTIQLYTLVTQQLLKNVRRIHVFFGQCHTKRRLGWVVASQAIYWYDNDKDGKTRFGIMRLK